MSAATADTGLASIAAAQPISDLTAKHYQSACRCQGHEEGYQGRMHVPLKGNWFLSRSRKKS
jgi:hypothetical protein